MKDAPLKAQKDTKSQRIPPLKAPRKQYGRPKGQNGGREAKMKAQKAKIKGKEAHKAKMKKINAHKPKNWKIDPATALINSLYGTLGKRTVFGNMWGGGTPRSEARSCEGYPPQGSKSRKEQKDAPPEGPKGHKEPKDTPSQGPTWQNGRPKGQNGGREAKMKAQKAKMKGNEAPQTKNEENQRPQAQKLEN